MVGSAENVGFADGFGVGGVHGSTIVGTKLDMLSSSTTITGASSGLSVIVVAWRRFIVPLLTEMLCESAIFVNTEIATRAN